MKLRQRVGLKRILIIIFWMLVEVLVVWNIQGFTVDTRIDYFLKLAILFLAFFALIELSVKLIKHIKYIKARNHVKSL